MPRPPIPELRPPSYPTPRSAARRARRRQRTPCRTRRAARASAGRCARAAPGGDMAPLACTTTTPRQQRLICVKRAVPLPHHTRVRVTSYPVLARAQTRSSAEPPERPAPQSRCPRLVRRRGALHAGGTGASTPARGRLEQRRAACGFYRATPGATRTDLSRAPPASHPGSLGVRATQK